MIDILILVIFPAALIFAAMSDITTMTISNWVSIVLIASFAVLSIAVGMPTEQILWHYAAGGLMLAICFSLFAAGFIGGGDAKLLSSTALWFGWNDMFALVFLTAIYGAPLCFAFMKFRAYPLPVWMAKHKWIRRLHKVRSGIPYGVAISGAALFLFPETPMMKMVGA